MEDFQVRALARCDSVLKKKLPTLEVMKRLIARNVVDANCIYVSAIVQLPLQRIEERAALLLEAVKQSDNAGAFRLFLHCLRDADSNCLHLVDTLLQLEEVEKADGIDAAPLDHRSEDELIARRSGDALDPARRRVPSGSHATPAYSRDEHCPCCRLGCQGSHAKPEPESGVVHSSASLGESVPTSEGVPSREVVVTEASSAEREESLLGSQLVTVRGGSGVVSGHLDAEQGAGRVPVMETSPASTRRRAAEEASGSSGTDMRHGALHVKQPGVGLHNYQYSPTGVTTTAAAGDGDSEDQATAASGSASSPYVGCWQGNEIRGNRRCDPVELVRGGGQSDQQSPEESDAQAADPERRPNALDLNRESPSVYDPRNRPPDRGSRVVPLTSHPGVLLSAQGVSADDRRSSGEFRRLDERSRQLLQTSPGLQLSTQLEATRDRAAGGGGIRPGNAGQAGPAVTAEPISPNPVRQDTNEPDEESSGPSNGYPLALQPRDPFCSCRHYDQRYRPTLALPGSTLTSPQGRLLDRQTAASLDTPQEAQRGGVSMSGQSQTGSYSATQPYELESRAAAGVGAVSRRGQHPPHEGLPSTGTTTTAPLPATNSCDHPATPSDPPPAPAVSGVGSGHRQDEDPVAPVEPSRYEDDPLARATEALRLPITTAAIASVSMARSRTQYLLSQETERMIYDCVHCYLGVIPVSQLAQFPNSRLMYRHASYAIERRQTVFMQLASEENIDLFEHKFLSIVWDTLFQGGADTAPINWGRVVMFFALGMAMAKKCYAMGKEQLVGVLIYLMGKFVDEKLSEWIEKVGGWEDFYEQFIHLEVPSATGEGEEKSYLSYLVIAGAVAVVSYAFLKYV